MLFFVSFDEHFKTVTNVYSFFYFIFILRRGLPIQEIQQFYMQELPLKENGRNLVQVEESGFTPGTIEMER